jgi:ABC-type oligopeptide transport system substrate-binding subunit
VVQLGEEQFIITRIVEVVPTPVPTATLQPLEPQPVALDLGYVDDLPNLDPQFASGKAGLDLSENLFVGLTNYNHRDDSIEPELAREWRLSSDGLTWTFDLREDIFWVRPISGPIEADSVIEPEKVRAVDAADLVFTIHRACQRANAVPDAFILFIIEGCQEAYDLAEPTEEDLQRIAVTAVDDHTLAVTLTEPASYFLTIASLPQMRPVPREFVEAEGNVWLDPVGDLSTGWQTPEKLVTNGPFIPASTPFSLTEATLFRNPLWSGSAQGNVDLVKISFGQDEESLYEKWQDKMLDLSTLPISERETLLKDSPNKALLVTNQVAFYIGYNFDSPIFQEAALRRAFSTAVDRTELTESLFEGRALGMRHFTPPGVVGAPPPNEVGVGYSPDFALRQMDISSIRDCKLLPPTTFLVSTADLSLLQAELIRDMWITELGCEEATFEIEQVEFGALLNRTNVGSEQRPDMWELAWPPHYPDANAVLSDLFHCTDGENRQNRPCEDADRLLRQARITPQTTERLDLYRQIEGAFFGESGSFPVIPLYVRGDYLLIQNWLVDFVPALSGGQQFDKIQVNQELKRLERDRSEGANTDS